MAFGDEGFLDLIEAWDGEGVVVHYDSPTGTWMFVAIHDTTLGVATGGTRMRVYERPEEGLRDALRLGAGMTEKWASVELPFGGGKAVLATPREFSGEERRGLLHRYGALLNTLDGAFGTGEDLGTTPDDMREIASVSKHVVQIHGSDDDGPSDPGPFTALGVFHGMEAALQHVHGTASLRERVVLIQGVGDVGDPLARLVADAGGRVLLCDIDSDRASALSMELGGEVVAPADVYTTTCDIFAPCALGAILSEATVPGLRCGIVAGSANNQLETARDADRLRDRGILYAPDYVINSGGALAFGLIHLGVRDVAELERRVAGIGDMLGSIFEDAQLRGESPVDAARRRVERVLSQQTPT